MEFQIYSKNNGDETDIYSFMIYKAGKCWGERDREVRILYI